MSARSSMGARAMRSAVAYDRLAAKAAKAGRARDARDYAAKATRYRGIADRDAARIAGTEDDGSAK
jgi:hypothetical protein